MPEADISGAIVEIMRQPVLVLEEDLAVAIANPAFLEHFKVEAEVTLGRSLYDLGNGQWNIAELRCLLAGQLENGAAVNDYRVEHDFESLGPQIVMLNARRFDQRGHRRILLAIDNITEEEHARKELVDGIEFSDRLIDSVREGLIVLHGDLRVELVNRSFCDMFEVEAADMLGRMIYDIGNRQWDIPELRSALEEILPQQKKLEDYEVVHEFPIIGRRTMLLNARQLDHVPRILLAISDETDRRKHVESQQLVRELQHRVKNVLANVQSIAAATIRRSQSLEQFQDAFGQRLQSIARTQDLLMRGAAGVADLRDIITFELGAHGQEENGRLSIEGPPVTLNREQVQTIAMVIHELATNATKFGAFAGPTGNLDANWCIERSGSAEELRLEWKETGVDMLKAPGSKGFGTALIERTIAYSLGGEGVLEFGSDGLSCRIAVPLTRRGLS